MSSRAALAALLWLGVATPGVVRASELDGQPEEVPPVAVAEAPAEEQPPTGDDEEARTRALLPFTRALGANGVVAGSLTESAATAGVPPVAMLDAERAFKEAVDRPAPQDGDSFYVRWEQTYSIDGRPIGVARLLWATCGGVRVATAYVPNGRSLEDDHYTYKLRWLERLRATLDEREDPAGPLAVCGDFNIAPDDRDVWSPAAFEGATHTSEPERAALGRLEDWGLEDVFRRHHDVGGLFSWWDYRGGDFHQGRGMRIDLVLATKALAKRSAMVVIDRNARKGKQPSDHAPVVVDFND